MTVKANKIEKRRATTQSDVAQQAGVSKVAVSAVLGGGYATARVSESTRQRILAAARDLDYRPNFLARSLRRQCTDLIGFYSGLLPLNARNLFHAEVIGGLEDGCDIYRKDLLLHGGYRRDLSKSIFPNADDIFNEIATGKVDGVVVLGYENDPLMVRLAESSQPTVAIANTVSGIPSVVVDDIGSGPILVNFLQQKRVNHAVYLTSMFAKFPAPLSVKRRCDSFVESAQKAGLRVEVSAINYLHEILSSKAPPEALLCWNDRIGYEALAICLERGLRVPQDIKIIGYDGIAQEIPPYRRLTTIQAPWAAVGREAVSVLMRRIAGEEVLVETVLPITLVEGDTT
jgi:LacI family transcriptional regulator